MSKKDAALEMAIICFNNRDDLESHEIVTLNACKEALEQPAWQGLTEEEFIYFTSWVDAETLSQIEQALKEKNHGA
jgi:hypothetical protein